MARRDVAVIGAGLYGTSLACCLAREGLSVALHERTLPGAGDTGRSFGMIRRHYSNEVTVRLAKRGCELLQADPSSAFVRTGYMLTVGPEQSHACVANVALGRKVGVDTELLDPDSVAAVEPLISLDGIAAAAYEPDAGVVDAGKLALAWFAEAVALGVEVHVGEPVTPDARVTAICAGGWSTEMAPEIPVTLRRIEISVHGEAPVRATVSDAVTNVVTRPIASGGAWVVAYGGDVRYARRDECDGLPDPAYEDAVRAALRERYPSIAGAPRIGGWAGAYDTTPDWNPAIGFLDEERYVVMGMSGHGLKLAPAVAECAAAQIAGREPPIDIAALRPQRFAEGDLLHLAYGPGARA
jgi:glycine/D-amino acid oxidase-like deaminating enzyme